MNVKLRNTPFKDNGNFELLIGIALCFSKATPKSTMKLAKKLRDWIRQSESEDEKRRRLYFVEELALCGDKILARNVMKWLNVLYQPEIINSLIFDKT